MSVEPGDVGWVAQKDWTSWFIRLGQRLKYHGSPAARYNHTFLVIGWNGELAEARPAGMSAGNISEYAGQDVAYRRPPYIAPGRNAAVQAMGELLTKHEKYNFLAILSISIALLTGTKVRLGVSGEMICSGAVAYALTRADIDCGDDESWDSPADLMTVAMNGRWPVVS